MPTWQAIFAKRLDLFVVEKTGCSRAEARRLIEQRQVRVDGHYAEKGSVVVPGSLVELREALSSSMEKRPQPDPDAPLEVIRKEEIWLALRKPAHMATHPLLPGERGTLANALVARFPECAGAADDPREGGMVHRLDSETTGVILAARNQSAWRALRSSFSHGQVEKEYLAIVLGEPPEEMEVDAPLLHAGRKMRIDPEGQSAHTDYLRLAVGKGCSLVRAKMHTGRMHQVRVHAASKGVPLVGDELYGGPPAPWGAGFFLHASRISFPSPVPDSEERLFVVCRPSIEQQDLLRKLGLG